MWFKSLYKIESIISREEKLILDDGIKLNSTIWFPSKSRGSWPALLMRQPYCKEIASTITYPHPTWWASHGFLVVIQDVRGQGDSEGCFSGFSQERKDTTKTLAWVRSLKECNGLIGTYGFSYQGATQLLATPGTQPPNCMAPAMTGLDECKHWSCDGGAFWWHIGISWGLQLAVQQMKRKQNFSAWEKIKKSLEQKTYLREGLELLERHDPQGMALKWLKNSSQENPKWNVHKPLKEFLKKPLLLIGGWWDPHLNGILDIYEQSIKAGGQPQLHIGAATHLQWWDDIHKAQLIFFKHHLQGITDETQHHSQFKLWNLTTKNWQTSLNIKESHSWALISNGLACNHSEEGKITSNGSGDGGVTIVHDPWRAVPSIGGHLSPDAGEANREKVDSRSDVAIFTSAPLSKTIIIEGRPSLKLTAHSDRKGFDLCVALSIIKQGNTKVEQISTGNLRLCGNDSLIPLRRQVILQPLLAEIKEGYRLRISIAGASWPAIGINPGLGSKLCGPPNHDCLVTTIFLSLKNSDFQIYPIFSSKGFQ